MFILPTLRSKRHSLPTLDGLQHRHRITMENMLKQKWLEKNPFWLSHFKERLIIPVCKVNSFIKPVYFFAHTIQFSKNAKVVFKMSTHCFDTVPSWLVLQVMQNSF